jgi:apolipoprotein D and lipocalin family protein
MMQAAQRARILALALALVGGAAAGCRHADVLPPPRVVAQVDLERYLGVWYEIASIPNRFQRGCVATTATYARRADGRISVVNACRDGSLDGEPRRIEGVAWQVADEPGGAKLLVRFFWPFRGDYWILELDPEYRWAIVGHPSRRYLWILSRTPQLDALLYTDLLRQVEAQGYDPSRLVRTPQPDREGRSYFR